MLEVEIGDSMFVCIDRSGGPHLSMTGKPNDVCSRDLHRFYLLLARVDRTDGRMMDGVKCPV